MRRILSNQGNNFGSKNTIFIYRCLELYYLCDLNCLNILIVSLTKVLIMQLQWQFFSSENLVLNSMEQYYFCQLLALRDSQVQHKSFKASFLNGIFLLQTAMTGDDFQSKYKVKTLLHLLINSAILADRTHFLIHTF